MTLTKVLKILAIFGILAFTIANYFLDPEMVRNSAISTPFILATIIAILTIWLLHHVHFAWAAFIMVLFTGVNLPMILGVSMAQEMVMIGLLIVVGIWIAQFISKIGGALFITAGLVMIMPESSADKMAVDRTLIMASLIALAVTPLVDVLTTKRKRFVLDEELKIKEKKTKRLK